MSETMQPLHETSPAADANPGAAPHPPALWFHQRAVQVLAGIVVIMLVGVAITIWQVHAAHVRQSQATAAKKAAAVAAAHKVAEVKRLKLSTALNGCSIAYASGVSLGDNGRSVSIDTEGKEDSSGASIAQLGCFLGRVNTPDAVTERMDSTRALDGRQEATWDDISASWSYHPNSGFNLIVTVD